MPLRTEVGLGLNNIALDEDVREYPNKGFVLYGKKKKKKKTQLPSPQKRGHSPRFSAHVYCGQTARWIKMPLGTEVSLGPGHIVLVRDPAPLQKGGTTSPFSAHVYCGQTAGCIKMPLDKEVGLGPGYIMLDEYPAPTQKGHTPNFRSMSVVAERSPISATAGHLFW